MTKLEDSFVHRCTIKHVEASLIDEQGHVALAQILNGKTRSLQGPTRDTDIERLTGMHNIHKGLKSFFQGRLWVVAMRIKQVHIVKVHTL